MTISNGNTILDTDLQEVFSDDPAPGAVGGGLSRDLDAQKDFNNGYTAIRFASHGAATHRFTAPDDMDIYVVGLTLFTRAIFDPATAPADIIIEATIKGLVTDLENDLPVPEHLFLTEPIANNDQRTLLTYTLPGGAAASAFSADKRYATYDLNNNRPCNTLLKGSTYEITMTIGGAGGIPAGGFFVETFICCKSKQRRN